MNSRILSMLLAGAVAAGPTLAQTAQPQADRAIDCDDPANAEEEICIALVTEGVTNFVPLVAPAAGMLGLAALGGGGSSSTISTTSTSN